MSDTQTPSSRAQPNPYLRTKVMTASPAELRLMLFEGAVKYAEKARLGLAEKDHEAAYEGISRCQQILIELINALEPDNAPELCQKLSGLYTFMYTRLIEALRERSASIVEEVIALLEYERETSEMLLKKLAEGNADGGGAADTSPAAEGTAASGGTMSVQG